MKPNDICTITNRSPGTVAFYLPDINRLREFYPKETKKIPYSEIEALLAQSGGRELLYNYFYIEEKDAVEEALNIKPEIEYYIKEEDLDAWMTKATLPQFQDALDFAPDGIKDLIKRHAVSLPLNDLQKCEAIKTQLGFDVLRAIENEKATLEDDELEGESIHASQRRVSPSDPTKEPERRVTPKYNVVKREEK